MCVSGGTRIGVCPAACGGGGVGRYVPNCSGTLYGMLYGTQPPAMPYGIGAYSWLAYGMAGCGV